MRKIISLAVIVAAAFCGCGYTTSSTLPGRLKSVSIANFKNRIDFSDTTSSARNIYLPMLEIDVRNAVVDRFLFDGALRVTEKDMADLVLTGELIRYERHVLRYQDNNEDALEYRVQITMSLKLWDEQNQEYMWEEPDFSGQATYFTTGAQASSEESAVKEAVKDLAKRIVERTVEYW